MKVQRITALQGNEFIFSLILFWAHRSNHTQEVSIDWIVVFNVLSEAFPNELWKICDHEVLSWDCK